MTIVGDNVGLTIGALVPPCGVPVNVDVIVGICAANGTMLLPGVER
jgi:hypothetical protein